jgi:hypothetical protein
MFYEAQLAFNEGGNDGFWRFQLRDKYGRWIKMGGSAMFEFRKPNDKNVYKAKGTFQGNIRRGASIIRVGEGEQLPPGDYEIDSRYIESIKAIINTTSAKPEIVDAPKSVNPDVEKQATEREMVAATVKDLEAGDIVQQSTEEALYGQINSVEHGDVESKINVTWSDGSNYDMTLPGEQKIKVWGVEPEGETVDATKEDSIWGDAAPNERDVVAAAYVRLPADMPVAAIAALDPDFATYPDSMKSDPESIKEVAIGAMQELVRKWNGSSIYDDSIKALHEVAREHFGISGASPVELTEGSKALMENKEAYAAVLDAMYGATQEMFANAGIEEITVYRGSKTDSSGVRPLSSWTTNEATAQAFAGSDGDTREMTVPVSQILSTAMSGGLGSWNENEVVLLGSPKTVDAPKPKSRFEPPTDPAEIEAMRVDAEKRAARMKELELEREARLREEAEAEAKKADESYRMAQEALLKKDNAKKKKNIEPGFKNWNNQIGKIFAVVEKKGEFGPRGDVMQATFIEKSGFNGAPRVLSQAEFDALEGETIYRGVSSEGMVSDYIESEVQYAGQGTFGNGTYNSNLKETAETYASGTGPDSGDLQARVMEMKLLPDANVLLFEEVPELREWASQKTTEFLEGYKKSGANPAEYQEAEWKLFNEGDWTNIAIMLGIDAVRFKVPLTDKEEYYTITLNRGKVAINGKS